MRVRSRPAFWILSECRLVFWVVRVAGSKQVLFPCLALTQRLKNSDLEHVTLQQFELRGVEKAGVGGRAPLVSEDAIGVKILEAVSVAGIHFIARHPEIVTAQRAEL